MNCTKLKFSIKDFFSKCDQILSFLRIWLHLLKKFLMEEFIFCVVIYTGTKSGFTFQEINEFTGKLERDENYPYSSLPPPHSWILWHLFRIMHPPCQSKLFNRRVCNCQTVETNLSLKFEILLKNYCVLLLYFFLLDIIIFAMEVVDI